MKRVRFDTLNVAVYDLVRQWSPVLARGQARDVLAALLYRLYEAGNGQLAPAKITLAQGVLAQELRLSRQWLGVVLARLQKEGWIEFKGAIGAATRFRAGPQLLQVERLLRDNTPARVHTQDDYTNGPKTCNVRSR